MTDLIKAAGLWRKTSQRTGREYLTGRLGGLRVLIFENKDASEGDPTHLLMLGEAENKQEPRPQPTRGQKTWDRSRQAERRQAQEQGGLVKAWSQPPESTPFYDNSAEAIRDLEGRD